MSNLGLERFLAGQGLSLARTKVGDRYVVEHMREHGYNVGGEQSGHIVLSDSEVCRRFEPVPQVLKNVRHSGGNPLNDSVVKSAIAEAEATLGSSARLVIRPSGTEPLIRVMAEGDDRQMIETVVDQLINVISGVRNAA
jgi:phosphoglucosamine mutase